LSAGILTLLASQRKFEFPSSPHEALHARHFAVTQLIASLLILPVLFLAPRLSLELVLLLLLP